jgi:hypothetical protein
MTSGSASDGPHDERTTYTWMTVGCGGLLLTMLCFAPPTVYLVATAEPSAMEPPELIAPPVLPPPDPSIPVDPNARHVSAIVEEVDGLAGIDAGSACEIDVTREDRNDGTFWCNAQIVCAGRLVYGGGSGPTRAGYFDCTLYEAPRHVVGEDASPSSGDRDPAMRIDTLRGTLRVRDDGGSLGAFTLRARVTGVR